MEGLLSWLRQAGLSFIPLFVAIDAIGTLPFILALVGELGPEARVRSLNYAIITAFGVGLGFLAIGKFVFSVLGISTDDFLIAGGGLLFVLSLRDLITGKAIEVSSESYPTVGVVPIGTPLVVGPATLSTLLLLSSQYSLTAVFFALLVNLFIAWVIFRQGERVVNFLGEGGQKAATKIASLLLAAIAVKMIRRGVMGFLSGL